jgi:hypothetical protein
MAKVLLGWHLWEILVIAEVIIGQECQGGLSDGQDHSQAKMQGRFRRWPMSLRGGTRGLVLVIIKVAPKQECWGGLGNCRGRPEQECQRGFSEITLGLSCKGGLNDGRGRSQVGLTRTCQRLSRSFSA